MESDDAPELSMLFLHAVAVMRRVLATQEEPLLNIIFAYRDGRWRLIIFPRTKHRPAVYFKEGNERVLISPASVDIGGLVITPVEQDFQRVNAAMIQEIFAEVSVDQNTLTQILDQI